MISFVLTFAFGAAVATAICWWRWKSTADERAALEQQVADLKSKVKS
jgi:hypothetical protein